MIGALGRGGALAVGARYSKTMRVCSGPGCLRAVRDDVRYCDECKPTASQSTDDIRTHQRTDAYNEELDKQRKSARWQKLRARVIREQPLCARCELRISELADHIVPAQIAVVQARESGKFALDYWAGYYLRSNLQGLCVPCHHIKTDEDKAHVGPWPDVVTIELAAPKRRYTF